MVNLANFALFIQLVNTLFPIDEDVRQCPRTYHFFLGGKKFNAPKCNGCDYCNSLKIHQEAISALEDSRVNEYFKSRQEYFLDEALTEVEEIRCSSDDHDEDWKEIALKDAKIDKRQFIFNVHDSHEILTEVRKSWVQILMTKSDFIEVFTIFLKAYVAREIWDNKSDRDFDEGTQLLEERHEASTQLQSCIKKYEKKLDGCVVNISETNQLSISHHEYAQILKALGFPHFEFIFDNHDKEEEEEEEEEDEIIAPAPAPAPALAVAPAPDHDRLAKLSALDMQINDTKAILADLMRQKENLQ